MFKQKNFKNFLLCIAIVIGTISNIYTQTPLISFSPNDGFRFELDMNNPQTTAVFTIFNEGLNAVSLNLNVESADSTYILYADEPDTLTLNGNIWIMRPDGSEKTQLTFDIMDREAVWSPDGSKIAFYSYRSGNADIWIMDSDGTNLMNLTNHDSSDCNPHFSPDGQYIIFDSNRDDPNHEIYRMSTSGANVARLTFNILHDYRARYSPDGQHFVTNSFLPGERNDIYVYTSDGQSSTNIGVNGIRDYQPSWTPDGKRVVWASGNHWISALEIVSAKIDSSDFRLEYGTAENDYIPRYSPDGQFLSFSKSTFYSIGGDEVFIWHKPLDQLIQITNNTPISREWATDWSSFVNSPSWLSITQNTFQLTAGDSINITTTIDVSNLSLGDHTASVVIHNAANDIFLTAVPINVQLTQGTGFNDQLGFPHEYSLSQNYPNPFNPSTTIEFSIPKSEFVTLKIYNLLGQEVATLVSDKLTPGEYKYTWDASQLASGVYIYKLETDNFNSTKKLILLK